MAASLPRRPPIGFSPGPPAVCFPPGVCPLGGFSQKIRPPGSSEKTTNSFFPGFSNISPKILSFPSGLPVNETGACIIRFPSKNAKPAFSPPPPKPPVPKNRCGKLRVFHTLHRFIHRLPVVWRKFGNSLRLIYIKICLPRSASPFFTRW